ncbi:expressed unknown protein [Seminavis robusta]|uniref:Uncharacterized protein n=1 Tax=Seminavis robusta TaxID=568900 RepID=A0A9N8HQ73_9STRA|nr:expressed unknown protein [Seminavis robusta]|eukprot:Sro1409_g270200.1 n/a (428) ;mRNA; f:16708-17991
MGCKHSRPALTNDDNNSDPGVEASEDPLESGIEDGPETESGLFSPVQPPEATPRDLRKIREELFAKHSLVAIASSATAETLGTMCSSERFLLQSLSGEGRDNIRFLTMNSKSETTLSTHTSLLPSHHYPAALYDDLQRAKLYAGRSATTNHQPLVTDRVPCVRSAPSESEESSSVVSGISHLDLQNVPPEGYEELDYLIDTMALSMEPLSANSERSSCMRKKAPQSLGALVDSLSYREEDDEEDEEEEDDNDDDYVSCDDGGDTADAEMGISTYEMTDTMASSPNKEGSVGFSMEYTNLDSRTTEMSRSESARNSMSLPSLEKSMSAEILSIMKTQALLKRSSNDKASVMFSISNASTKKKIEIKKPQGDEDTKQSEDYERGCGTTTRLVSCGDDGSAKLLKYHRTNSVMPKRGDAVSVCSELGRYF